MEVAEPKWFSLNTGAKTKTTTDKFDKELPKILAQVAEAAGQEANSIHPRYLPRSASNFQSKAMILSLAM